MRSSSSVISTICLKTRLRNRCSLGNMDSIVDNLVSLINAKRPAALRADRKIKPARKEKIPAQIKHIEQIEEKKQIIQIIEVKQTVPQ